MKLFVDDIRVPEDIYPGQADEWHLCRTITEAIRILATRDDICVVSLDHDIQCGATLEANGLWTGGHTSPETYEPIAWYLNMMLGKSRGDYPELKKITLHSANAVGRKKMRDILQTECDWSEVQLNELPGCSATALE